MQLPQYKSVSKLTLEIKATLEMNFKQETVVGEVSNFVAHSSGHWYFTLKDATAAIACTMWRGNNQRVSFTPRNGMQIIVTGDISVYPPRGNYQLDVQVMKNVGVGDLQIAFELLKEKLNKEGLFDQAKKRPIPNAPGKVGVVTSPTGAAWQDIISVAKRRFPLVELVLAPARVQGEGAAESIAGAIDELNKFDDIEVLIVGRGGGSLEDLWAFNEEVTARAIARSKIPVVSAVGHEIDFSISDFVADLRAATPTAAMELVTPDGNKVFAFLDDKIEQLDSAISNNLQAKKDIVNRFITSPVVATPINLIKISAQKLDLAVTMFDNNMANYIKDLKNRLNSALLHLKANDHKRIMRKGFVFVTQNNKLVKVSTDLDTKQLFDLNFIDAKISIEGKNE
ncbi:MAG: exodeoxyribonuclease VII large subunit [Ignavibacteriales bacterium]|nr:MAG: exodeoxyribonuclease VII large subunit [Ignavibacteriaceae bacterium]MBW7871871.1 exodeoxyribonuclease VII large subunit [Ignavibacteria bacterium]MCZ2144279.1 exodeoxyribonuclease VII large subunit [Ignavibacteriales bacterium]OQY74793.1 MAG: exodeoxyribonuclease VII large subunit [Ignavibacteriales bacterium UTCHB3]MBV6446232.1 Exodeoxyribonuclease 7 large subunit [Ignavibacteriaceae bacterium]